MKATIEKYQGGGIVFIDANGEPVSIQWRKSYETAKKYWFKEFKSKGRTDVFMRPVADVQMFFMAHNVVV